MVRKIRGLLGWIGTEKEKDVLQDAQIHMRKVGETVFALQTAFNAYFEGNYKEKDSLIKRVAEAEKEADAARREILAKLSTQVLLPADRTDLLCFVESIDNIGNYARSASRLLRHLNVELPEELADKIKDLVTTTSKCVKTLEDTVKSLEKGIDITCDGCADVELLEKKADKQKMEIIGLLLKSGLDAPNLLLVFQTVEIVEHISDTAEETVDLIRLMGVK